VRWALLVIALVGCRVADRRPASAKVEPPAGEIWVTDQQLRDARIEFAPLEERDVPAKIVTSGRIAFDDQRVSHIYSPVTGRVVSISAAIGAHVHRGDVLALIDSPDLGSSEADLAKARADYVAANKDYLREKALWEDPHGRATSKKDLEQAEESFRRARAELERAQYKMRLLGGSASGQNFALRSGIDGEVIARNITPNVEIQGQYGGGQAVELFTVGDVDHVWLLADIYEVDVARVHVGSPVSMRLVAYPDRTFDGTVEWMSSVLDPTTRTARIRCGFDNKERLLKPEMYATVEMSGGTRKTLAIPRSAFFRLGDTTVVFARVGVASDGRIRIRRVPITVTDDSQPLLAVERGPPKGTMIVTSGGILLIGQ